MIAARSQQGLNQFVKAVTQSAGGQRVCTSFPNLKREWEERIENLPSTIPAFASNMPVHKVCFQNSSQPGQLFSGNCKAITGIGGLCPLCVVLFHGFSACTNSCFSYVVGHQFRMAHTDVTIPSFKDYRRESTK